MWPIRAQPGDLVKMVQQTHTHIHTHTHTHTQARTCARAYTQEIGVEPRSLSMFYFLTQKEETSPDAHLGD